MIYGAALKVIGIAVVLMSTEEREIGIQIYSSKWMLTFTESLEAIQEVT